MIDWLKLLSFLTLFYLLSRYRSEPTPKAPGDKDLDEDWQGFPAGHVRDEALHHTALECLVSAVEAVPGDLDHVLAVGPFLPRGQVCFPIVLFFSASESNPTFLLYV